MKQQSDLPALIEEAETRIAELRRQRGRARLDATPFDDSALADAERERAALADAVKARDERNRAAGDAERARRLDALGAVLMDQEESRLKALQRAEAGARSLVGGLNDALVAASAMRATISRMELPVPLPLAESVFVDRLSQRFAAILGTIERYPARFGQLAWRPSWRTAGEDWRAGERDELADDLAPLTPAAEGPKT